MNYVQVRFKAKFQTNYNSGSYSYKTDLDLVSGDLVAVDTCYGMEIAQVVKDRNLTVTEMGAATKKVYCLIKEAKGKPVKPKKGLKSTPKVCDNVW